MERAAELGSAEFRFVETLRFVLRESRRLAAASLRYLATPLIRTLARARRAKRGRGEYAPPDEGWLAKNVLRVIRGFSSE